MSLILHRHGLIGAVTTPVIGFSARTTASNAAGIISSNWVADWNPNGSFNAATGVFTAPVSGRYHYAANCVVPGGGVAGSDANAVIAINGINQAGRATYFVNSASGAANTGCNKVEGVLNLIAGDTIRLEHNRTTADNFFTVYQIPYVTGFQATRSAGSGSSGSNYITGFSNSEFDSHTAFDGTTGTWTVPTTGVYYLYGMAFSWETSGMSGWQAIRNGAKINGIGDMFHEWAGGLKGGTDAFGYVGNLTAGDSLRYYYFNRTKGLVGVGAHLLSGVVTNAFGAYNWTTTDGSGNLGGWTEEVDMSGDFNPTTGVYTAPTTGKYFIGGKTHGVTSGSVTQSVVFYKNGVITHSGQAYQASIAFRSTAASGRILNLTSGDQITMRGTGGLIAADTNFFGYKLTS